MTMSIRSAQRQVAYAGRGSEKLAAASKKLVSLHASVPFAFFLSYPYQDSVALIFGSVVLVSVSLIRHYSAKPAITWQACELGRQRWRTRKELGAALP